MAYIVKYEDDYLFDPYTNDDAIYDVKLSAEVNAAVYFDFSIPCTHHLYDKIAERDGIVRVYSDKKLLFIGEITEISNDFNQNKTVSCVDPRDHLDDVMIRPYSTVEGEEPLLAPSSIDGYFQWLVDQYNNGMINAKFHFQVGVNQGGLLTKSNYIYKKNEGLPGVGSEIENEILDTYGGYLILTYPEGTPTLNLYSDVHEANTQIIDFGVNLIDFTRTSSTNDQYTAVRPVGGTPEKTDDDPDDYQPKPVTIEELGDGVTFVDSDYVKKGDVVYSVSKVNRYGYREYNWTESDTLDANTLLEEAVADLKKQIEPKITIDVKAVDLALFMEDYDHLECGEVARIRSKPHGVDEYLLVSSMSIDLQDPSQTSYTLGQAYDSLTGEQSAYVKSLNSGINSSLDAVAGLDQTVKDQATKVDQAVTDAGNALDTANDAKDTANTAKDTADNAQQAAEDAQTSADNAQQAADAAKDTANTAKDTADNAQKLVQNIQQTVIRIDQDLEETSNKAQDAYDKADQLAGTIETVQTDIQGLEGEVDGLTVTVTGAAEDASSALKQVAQTQMDLSGFKTSVSQTYSTKTELEDAITQEVADRNAAIQVGIDGISSTVSSNYTELTEKVNAAQSDADDALAAAQTASEDLAEFTGTITGELSDLQSQIDGSIQTWFYNGVPTISNPPAEDWTTNDLKNNHLGDLYYDLDTGYAYRFMVQNGIYSWSRLADSDVTTALQNAAKAQDTADNKRRVFVTTPKPPYDVGDLWVQGSNGDIKRCQTAKTSSQSYAAADWVLASKYTDDTKADQVEGDLNDYKNVVETTYATKSSVTQTANSIRSEVSSTYTTKEESQELEDYVQTTYATKTYVDQQDDSITLTAQAAQTAATNAKSAADAAQDAADAAQSTANTAKNNAATAQTAANNAQSTANTANNRATYQYGTCATAAATAAKVVSLSGFSLFTGATIQVKFAYANTANSPTLNVNSTGAKTIRAYNANLTSSSRYNWVANSVVTFVYDGTYWNIADTSSLSKYSTLQVSVDGIEGRVSDAEGNISTLTQTASGLEVRLDSAEDDIATAQSTANTANSNATTAKNSAQTALNTADDAADDAASALTTANTAKTNAATALTTAKNAQTTASNAAKTATNYLGFSSSGLVIGTNSSGTGQSGLQSNVLLDSESVNIRKGATVLSTFAATLIEIGKNAMSSIIRLCGNALQISANIDDGNTNAIISTNPSSGSGGRGTLELRSSNVGTARSSIKLNNSQIVFGADFFDFSNGKVSGGMSVEPLLLWSGTLSVGGSVTINNLSRFNVIIVENSTGGRFTLARDVDNSRFIGVGGTSSGAFIFLQAYRILVNGSTLQLANANELNLGDGAPGAMSSISLKKIYGLL